MFGPDSGSGFDGGGRSWPQDFTAEVSTVLVLLMLFCERHSVLTQTIATQWLQDLREKVKSLDTIVKEMREMREEMHAIKTSIKNNGH